MSAKVGCVHDARRHARGRREEALLWLHTVGCIVTLALGILFPSLAAAQRPAKVPRIGVLTPYSSRPLFVIEALREGLRALGYVEGDNVVIEYRYAEERYERLPDLAAELVRLQVDVIFANSAPATHAAKQATSTIPIVMETLTDPVRAGFVTSLARPGGNITGVTGLAPELSGKRLELLTQAIPGVARVAILVNPANPNTPAVWTETESAGRALGVHLQRLEVRDPAQLDNAFAAMTSERADALLVLPDPMLLAQRNRIVDFAAARRLPAMYADVREWMEAGGLMFYGPNLAANVRRAATYVDKILKGAKPADLPVEQPMTFELIINLKTAQALGITIPSLLLFRVDEVIQ